MDGVTVLHEFMATTEFWFLIPASVGVTFLIAVIYCLMEGDDSATLGFIFVVLCAGIAFGVWSQDRVTHMEAIVSSETPFVEVLEYYKVVERKGDIWVLEPIVQEQ